MLSNPGVSVAISGMESKQAIDENVAVASRDVPLTAEEAEAIDRHLQHLKAQADLYCTGCGYCMPCPKNVRIPRIFRTHSLAKVYGLWDRARRDYAGIVGDQWDPGAQQGDACSDCGVCETKCPQKLSIRQQLREAHRELSGK